MKKSSDIRFLKSCGIVERVNCSNGTRSFATTNDLRIAAKTTVTRNRWTSCNNNSFSVDNSGGRCGGVQYLQFPRVGSRQINKHTKVIGTIQTTPFGFAWHCVLLLIATKRRGRSCNNKQRGLFGSATGILMGVKRF